MPDVMLFFDALGVKSRRAFRLGRIAWMRLAATPAHSNRSALT